MVRALWLFVAHGVCSSDLPGRLGSLSRYSPVLRAECIDSLGVIYCSIGRQYIRMMETDWRRLQPEADYLDDRKPCRCSS